MKTLNLTLVALAVMGLSACSDGDDGANGTNGTNGSNGANGIDGNTSLVAQTQLAVGDMQCPNSGVQIDSGIDTNADGILQSTEITATEYVCAPGVTSVSSSDILSNVNNDWFVAGQQAVANARQTWLSATNPEASFEAAQSSSNKVAPMQAAALQELKGRAKNVILFVGDGMGISTVTAARILEGQIKGKMGEEHNLSFDRFPFAGLAKTYNVDAQTPDSAGTMTAMMSGVKSDAGVLGVNEHVERGDCSTVAGTELVTALELAEIAGKSTGVISTARITHATPAATYAKSADRNWEDISDMPAEAVSAGCKDIADQLVNFESNLEARLAANGADINIDGIEVIMGGGRRHFLPKDAAYNSADAVSEVEGDRTDGRDLTAEWKTTYADGVYVMDQTGFDALDNNTQRVLGLFNESHMQYEADRGNDVAGEPSVAEMTGKAIEILDNNDEGFFLMVESGRIDHGHHAGSAYNALTDTIAFSEAVATAVEMTDMSDTLIIVTADHGHVFTIAGYPKRGNPILGKVVGVGQTEPSAASDGLPYTTLGYTNGRGFKDLGNETDADAGYNEAISAGRVDLTDIDTAASGFHQEALVPLSSETHAGEDVGIYAQGPGALLVNGTNEQSVIFHVMDFAADLTAKANAAISMK